jgi:hypothetical protein
MDSTDQTEYIQYSENPHSKVSIYILRTPNFHVSCDQNLQNLTHGHILLTLNARLLVRCEGMGKETNAESNHVKFNTPLPWQLES